MDVACPAGICPGGICPGGICPAGICPDTTSDMIIMITLYNIHIAEVLPGTMQELCEYTFYFENYLSLK